jgi:hypothetical protein
VTAAVLDACVLYQGVLTNFLLCLADAGLFDPIWSQRIHDEWARALGKRLPPEKIAYRMAEMDRSFPGALCPVDEALLAEATARCRSERERKDAHVIATAQAAGACRIVTHNTRDFAGQLPDPSGLAAIDPDGFCTALLEADRHTFLEGARTHRESMQRSAVSRSDYPGFLAVRAAVPVTARALGRSAAHLRRQGFPLNGGTGYASLK